MEYKVHYQCVLLLFLDSYMDNLINLITFSSNEHILMYVP